MGEGRDGRPRIASRGDGAQHVLVPNGRTRAQPATRGRAAGPAVAVFGLGTSNGFVVHS